MNRREKVETGLYCCRVEDCPSDCPYRNNGITSHCIDRLHDDALNEMQTSTADKVFKWFCVIASGILFGIVIAKVALLL